MSNPEFQVNFPNNTVPIRRQYLKSPAFRPLNWHEDLELLYICSGSGTIHSHLKEYPIHAGEICVFDSFDLHTISTDSEVNFLMLNVDAELCRINGIDISSLSFRTIFTDAHIIYLLRKMLEEYDNRLAYYNLSLNIYALEIILHLMKNYRVSQNDLFSNKNKPFNNIRIALGYITANYTNDITLHDVSAQTGVNAAHLAREFKKYTHTTVISYINSLRIKHAQRLIAQKKYTMSEIAEKSGFNNLSYFSRTFRQYTGVSPSQYLRS